jgi:hypothetical protein
VVRQGRASSVVSGGDQRRPERRVIGGRRRSCCGGGRPTLTTALQHRVREERDRETRDRAVVRVLRHGPGPHRAIAAVLRADARTEDERAARLACGLQRVQDARAIVGVKRAEPVGIRGRRAGRDATTR